MLVVPCVNWATCCFIKVVFFFGHEANKSFCEPYENVGCYKISVTQKSLPL